MHAMFHHLKSEIIHLAKGDYVFHQAQSVSNFYYLKTGKVKLVRHTIEGEQALVYVALAGETFAEASLFSPYYHCSAVADAHCELVVCKKATLLSHLEGNPRAMNGLLRQFSQQLIDLRTINEIKNIRSAKERIMAFLRHRMDAKKDVHLTVSLKDVASYIGLAHETLYRELKNLEAEKKLLRQDGCFRLL